MIKNLAKGPDGLAGLPGAMRRPAPSENRSCIICPMGPQGKFQNIYFKIKGESLGERGQKGKYGLPGAMGRLAPSSNQGMPGPRGDVG